jgi:hypothetical protein
MVSWNFTLLPVMALFNKHDREVQIGMTATESCVGVVV